MLFSGRVPTIEFFTREKVVSLVFVCIRMLRFFFFLISVNFCFSFVSNSLAYITIPKTKERQKSTDIEN